jgi:uncharacterized protein YoxC
MSINTQEIETLQKQKNDLLKKVDPLIAKKKKLYSDVDITSPKLPDEKKLDKELADLFSEINALVHKIAKLKKSQNEGRNTMKLKSAVNEEIAVGKMVKVVDNPYWEAALGKKGPFKRKVKMIVGDSVFFTDGSNSSMKYVKEDIQPTNEADLNWNAVQNVIINFLKMNTKILDKRVQAKDTEGVKSGLKSIISGLTNAQRGLKLESVNEAYDVELFWSGLSGNDRKIGRFLVSKNDYNKLEKNLKGHISFDLYDDTATGKILSYEDIMNAIKNTKYGKIAFKKESVNEVILEVAYTDKTDIKGSLLNNNEFTSLISPKVFNWVRGMEVKIFHSPGNTFTITDGKLEMVINMAKPISVIKPIGRVRSEIKALFNENVKTLPHLKKVSNEYYVDTPFIQYSNKFGNLVHAGFGDFSLKTSGGEVYFTRTSKQMPDFVGRTHTMSGDATAIKKLIASMSSKYELNENVKKSTYNRVARILNNGKLDIY